MAWAQGLPEQERGKLSEEQRARVSVPPSSESRLMDPSSAAATAEGLAALSARQTARPTVPVWERSRAQ
jgi:hypothetical protein